MESVVLGHKISSALFLLGCELSLLSARFNISDSRNETEKRYALKSLHPLLRSKGVLNLPYKLGYKKVFFIYITVVYLTPPL